MFNKIIRILIHPLFIYCIIASLECIPYVSHADKRVYHEMPKVGDNFKTKDLEYVYYFSGKGKYTYSSSECYFNLGNPSYGTNYKDGGIKTIDKAIADKIPLLGDMCDKNNNVKLVKTTALKEKIFSTNFLLDYFSGISHIFSYLILSLSLLYHLRTQKSKYGITFICVFLGGGILEFVQEFFIEGRHASYEDQISNCTGALAAMLIFWIFSKTTLYKRIL